MVTIGLAGYDGGRMAEVDTTDHLFVVPSGSGPRIQEAQTSLYHALWELVQHELVALGTPTRTRKAVITSGCWEPGGEANPMSKA